MNSKEQSHKRCIYSEDCFKCPLSDCKCPANAILTANALPNEHLYLPNSRVKGKAAEA